MRKHIFVLLLVSCMAIALDAADFWQPPTGPHGGHVTTILRTSGGVIYLGTFTTGIFKSNNNGQSWQSVNYGLSEFQINTLANDTENLYAAVGSSGLYFSTDEGATWSVYSSTIRDESIQAMFVKSNGDMLIAARGQGIYKSKDAGASWEYMGLKGKIMQTIRKSPNGDLFTAGNDGVYRLNPATQIWERKSEGIPNVTIKTLAFSTSDGAIYCGTYGAGVLRSDDNGETWTPKLNGFKNYILGWIEQLVFDADGTLWAAVSHDDFGGLYFTGDGGENWHEKDVSISQKKFLSLLIHGDDMFIGVFKFGIYHATRPFANWTPCTQGFWFYKTKCLTSDSQSRVFAGTAGGGIFRCEDSHSWREKNVGVYEHDVGALHRTAGDTIFAGVFPKGVLRSVDGGESWLVHNSGIHNLTIHCFAHDEYGRVFLGNNLGLCVTANGGESWERVDAPLINQPVLSLFTNSSGIYVGTQLGKILFSHDKGKSWADISDNVPAQPVTSIVQLDGQTYAGIRTGGVFCYDGVSNWIDQTSNLPTTIINVLLVQNGNIYAGTEKGVFVLDKNSWLPLNSGFVDTNIHDLHVDDNGFFWAATDIGVARSAAKIAAVSAFPQAITPTSIVLYATAPNPFNASTVIRFTLQRAAFVTLEIFDISGRHVETLIEAPLAPGYHTRTWQAEKQSSGIYFARLRTDGKRRVIKMTLQK